MNTTAPATTEATAHLNHHNKPSMRLIEVPVESCDYPSQPRSFKPAGYIEGLAANIKAYGQKVPAIGWFKEKRFQLADGGCRLDAVKMAGKPMLLALDLGAEPDAGQLLIAQASIDLHKQHLPPVDRARLFQGIMATQNWNGKQTAQALGVSETYISRFLPLVRLCPELQKAVNEGELEWTKGSLIALETEDHEGQRQLAKAALAMTRDGFAASLRKPKSNGQPEVKTGSLRIDMGGGATITVKGPEFTLAQAADLLLRASKEAARGSGDGLTVATFGKVMKDRNKGKPGGAA